MRTFQEAAEKGIKRYVMNLVLILSMTDVHAYYYWVGEFIMLLKKQNLLNFVECKVECERHLY